MKEIGKLIELLNEYAYGENKELYYRDAEMIDLNSDRVISKKFLFIKWLVENDKIDIHNIPPISITKGGEETAYNEPVMLDDSLLMLLAIQDEPIRFLCEILK